MQDGMHLLTFNYKSLSKETPTERTRKERGKRICAVNFLFNHRIASSFFLPSVLLVGCQDELKQEGVYNLGPKVFYSSLSFLDSGWNL